jgi:hypothetical protein
VCGSHSEIREDRQAAVPAQTNDEKASSPVTVQSTPPLRVPTLPLGVAMPDSTAKCVEEAVVLVQDRGTGAPMIRSNSLHHIGWLDVSLSYSPACKTDRGVKNGASDRNNDSEYVDEKNKDRRRNSCPAILTVKELQVFAFDSGFGTSDLGSVTEGDCGVNRSCITTRSSTVASTEVASTEVVAIEAASALEAELNETLIQQATLMERRASLPFSRSLGIARAGSSWIPQHPGYGYLAFMRHAPPHLKAIDRQGNFVQFEETET